MMRVTGPRGLGEQGLLDAPPTAHKNKPKFFMYNTHTPHNTHTHNCGCTQSNINADTNTTGEERDRINIDTTSGITTDKELRNIRETDIPQPSEPTTATEVTNVSREERDQNNTDTTDSITDVRDFRWSTPLGFLSRKLFTITRSTVLHSLRQDMDQRIRPTSDRTSRQSSLQIATCHSNRTTDHDSSKTTLRQTSHARTSTVHQLTHNHNYGHTT